MSVVKNLFGKTLDGRDVYTYRIENNNKMAIEVITFGGILKNVFVPDANGKIDDVTVGYDKLEMFFENDSCFGGKIGPIANRTGNAQFTLDGITYHLPLNDCGKNNLHTDGKNGFHKRLWDAVADEAANSVTLSLEKEDGDLGHPGNLKVSVTYTLTDDNEVVLHYHADTDKKTVINMTDHSYFNLSGLENNNIEHTKVTLAASNFTPVDETKIPTGEIRPVKGTPMDFTMGKAIGQDIRTPDDLQLKLGEGYDHNFVVDEYDGKIKKVATAVDDESGRTLEVYTDLPGFQFYSGNFIATEPGKQGIMNCGRKGFCIETQYYPNSANEKNFPQPIFDSQHPYDTTTVYKFIW